MNVEQDSAGSTTETRGPFRVAAALIASFAVVSGTVCVFEFFNTPHWLLSVFGVYILFFAVQMAFMAITGRATLRKPK